MRRLAVLTTFEGDWPFTQRHPDDGQKVAAALQPLRPDWVFDTWPVSKGRWPDDVLAYDGIVITGSPASVNDDSDWIRCRAALQVISEAGDELPPRTEAGKRRPPGSAKQDVYDYVW